MEAETIMRQIWFGESRGVLIFRTFHDRYAEAFKSARLERELRSQIADEIRHARTYLRMIAKRNGARVGLAGVDPSWRTIIQHIAAEGSFSTTLIGMYGLLEPFNLIALRTFLLPLLDKADHAEVEQIARDEARHVGMFDLFAELIERNVLCVDEAKCMAMIRVFLEAQRDGIILPSGERMCLPQSERREFMRHVGQLTSRIQAWSAKPGIRCVAPSFL
jgi:hypothetical protein